MKNILVGLVSSILVLGGCAAFGQIGGNKQVADSAINAGLHEYNQRMMEVERLRVDDSVKKAKLEEQLRNLKTTDNLQKQELINKLKVIEENEQKRIADKKARIDSLRGKVKGYPVLGVMEDTLFTIYSRLGSLTAQERAANITKRIRKLYDDDFFKVDSILTVKSENTIDLAYGEMVVVSVTENDAFWDGTSIEALSVSWQKAIKESIVSARTENSFKKIAIRIGLVLLVVTITWLLFWAIGKGYNNLLLRIKNNKNRWLKSLSYKDYTFLSAEQELQVVIFMMRVLRWFVYIVLLYISLPIIFSIFPFSRDWADALFHLVWSPFKGILLAVWHFFPNLFRILVIYFVMRYFIRFVKYIFHEIDSGNLKIAGFHADWAMPTYSIVRILLYAFMFVLIFPYLPGSDSNIFKGVSVFIGVLFSLGSSSAIANMVAGLVITYMRPFKIGDRIKIGDAVGDVVEKTLLVTRIKTIKNEIITIPNSTILSSNTVNYSSEAESPGLIVHTTVTIGYDVPWKDMHQALIDAALRTNYILQEPKPFVLQTSLEDFYVAYQINAYTHEASMQGGIYSQLHQNIQDVCNERGIEIMSPHYRASRDGNTSTIPASYLPEDYKVPSFNVKVEKSE